MNEKLPKNDYFFPVHFIVENVKRMEKNWIFKNREKEWKHEIQKKKIQKIKSIEKPFKTDRSMNTNQVAFICYSCEHTKTSFIECTTF